MARMLFWTAFLGILVLAFIPTYDHLPPVVLISDILNHSAAFLLLYLLHTIAYPSAPVKKKVIHLFSAGVFIEIVQVFLPTRDASLKDLTVDTAAILFALSLEQFYRRFRPAALEASANSA